LRFVDDFVLLLDKDAHHTLTDDLVAGLVQELDEKNPDWHFATLTDASYSMDSFHCKEEGHTESFWHAANTPFGSHGVLLSKAGAAYFAHEVTKGTPSPFDCYLRFRAQELSGYVIKRPLVGFRRPAGDRPNLPANVPACNIVIPYRDRLNNLRGVIKGLSEHLKDVPHRIRVVEQEQGKPFNRGMLSNVGFHLFGQDAGHWSFHDADLVPESPSCDYSLPELPTHMSRFNSQTNYASTYDEAFGGVVLFTPEHFMQVNGYSNKYWGWGLEDDDLFKRCQVSGLAVARRYGRYFSQSHTPKCERPFVGSLDERAAMVKQSSPDWKANFIRLRQWYDYRKDGLNNLKYTVNDTYLVEGAVVKVVSI
jgi:beta-1,4-galactosyltransferase 1